MKDKPVKYWIRTEIEEIIKEKSVDRERFYEYLKTNYQKIINKFYYAFMDYKKYPKVELSYCWLYFRQELKEIDCVSETIGWVYEGYIDTITDVLNEVDGLLEDFYIVTLQFDKFAAYTDDGQCLCIYEKQ